MKRLSLSVMTAFAISATVAAASPMSLVDDSTLGLYNGGIGNLLNGSSSFFPAAGTAIDPTASLATAPDLSAASTALGAWLTTPATPGGTWSAAPVAIPSSWPVESETAIIYEIDGGTTGLTNVIASFGVDNGILVWLNGTFIGGDQAPGGASPNEYTYALGTLSSGSNYLQILREDHGGGTGYTVSVTGEAAVVPLPAALPLLLAGLGAIAVAGRRRTGAASAA